MKNTTTAGQTAKADLRHTILTKDTDGNRLEIYIRLNDECKNGHQDFSITASAWEKGKPKTDKWNIYGGCCHEEILAVRPDLLPFVKLHLSDWEGVPMYAVENGFYHLKNGFWNTQKPINIETATDEHFCAKFCEYYRITPEQFKQLKTSENSLQYALFLQSLGILKQWKEEANKAIKMLEGMTGSQFLPNSKKSQYNLPK